MAEQNGATSQGLPSSKHFQVKLPLDSIPGQKCRVKCELESGEHVMVEIVCPANGTPGMIIMVMVDMNEIRAVLRCQSRIQQPRKAAARDRNARGMGSSVKQGCSAPRKKRTEEDVDVISINSSDNESSWDGSLEGMPPQGDLFDEIPPLPMKGDIFDNLPKERSGEPAWEQEHGVHANSQGSSTEQFSATASLVTGHAPHMTVSAAGWKGSWAQQIQLDQARLQAHTHAAYHGQFGLPPNVGGAPGWGHQHSSWTRQEGEGDRGREKRKRGRPRKVVSGRSDEPQGSGGDAGDGEPDETRRSSRPRERTDHYSPQDEWRGHDSGAVGADGSETGSDERGRSRADDWGGRGRGRARGRPRAGGRGRGMARMGDRMVDHYNQSEGGDESSDEDMAVDRRPRGRARSRARGRPGVLHGDRAETEGANGAEGVSTARRGRGRPRGSKNRPKGTERGGAGLGRDGLRGHEEEAEWVLGSEQHTNWLLAPSMLLAARPHPDRIVCLEGAKAEAGSSLDGVIVSSRVRGREGGEGGVFVRFSADGKVYEGNIYEDFSEP